MAAQVKLGNSSIRLDAHTLCEGTNRPLGNVIRSHPDKIGYIAIAVLQNPPTGTSKYRIFEASHLFGPAVPSELQNTAADIHFFAVRELSSGLEAKQMFFDIDYRPVFDFGALVPGKIDKDKTGRNGRHPFFLIDEAPNKVLADLLELSPKDKEIFVNACKLGDAYRMAFAPIDKGNREVNLATANADVVWPTWQQDRNSTNPINTSPARIVYFYKWNATTSCFEIDYDLTKKWLEALVRSENIGHETKMTALLQIRIWLTERKITSAIQVPQVLKIIGSDFERLEGLVLKMIGGVGGKASGPFIRSSLDEFVDSSSDPTATPSTIVDGAIGRLDRRRSAITYTTNKEYALTAAATAKRAQIRTDTTTQEMNALSGLLAVSRAANGRTTSVGAT